MSNTDTYAFGPLFKYLTFSEKGDEYKTSGASLLASERTDQGEAYLFRTLGGSYFYQVHWSEKCRELLGSTLLSEYITPLDEEVAQNYYRSYTTKIVPFSNAFPDAVPLVSLTTTANSSLFTTVQSSHIIRPEGTRLVTIKRVVDLVNALNDEERVQFEQEMQALVDRWREVKGVKKREG